MKTVKTKDKFKVKSITDELARNDTIQTQIAEAQADQAVEPSLPFSISPQQAQEEVERLQNSTENKIYDVIMIPSVLINQGVPVTEARQRIEIDVPEPELGFNTAKVVVYTDCGKSEEFDYIYEDACVFSPTPDSDYSENLDEDIENAYEECSAVKFLPTSPGGVVVLSNIVVATFEGVESDSISEQDIVELTCPDGSTITVDRTTGNVVGGGSGLNPIQIVQSSVNPIEGSEVYNGSNIIYSLGFSGNGSYRILGIIDDGNFGGFGQTIYQLTGSVSTATVSTVSNSFFIPLVINENYKKLRIRVEMLGPSEQKTRFTEFTHRLSVVPVDSTSDSTSSVEIEMDSDSADSNKETVIIPSIVADLNKTIADLGNKDARFITVDPYRNSKRAFYIKENLENNTLVYPGRPSSMPVTVETGLRREEAFRKPESLLINSQEDLEIFKNPISNVLDVVYTYERPYTKEEMNLAGKKYGSRTIEITPEYNFYYKEYEEFIKDPTVTENILPNMYFLQLIDQYVKDYKFNLPSENSFVYDDNFNKTLITNNTFMPPSLSPMAIQKTNTSISELDPDIYDLVEVATPLEPVRTLGKHLGSDYYEYFIDNYQNSPLRQMGELLNRSKNIVIPYSFLEKLQEFSKKDELYPMHIDIKFDTNIAVEAGSTIDNFSYKLRNNYFGDLIFLSCVNRFIDNDVIQQTNFVKQEYAQENTISESLIRHLDLGQLLLSDYRQQPQDNFVFLGDYSLYKSFSNFSSDLLEYREKLVEDLFKVVKQNFRSYKNIISGHKCYRETLFYRIAKYKGVPSQDTEVQNVWIPNDPNKGFLRYFDTQVKYDEEYTYRIYSYDMVVSNEYSMSRARNNSSIGTHSYIDNVAKILLIENVYDEFVAKVKDRPPVFPEVSLNTYRQVDNKILISLKKGTATYKSEEIIIEETDNEIFSDIRKFQMLKEQDLIEFSGDDIVKAYQVFRTTQPPKNYSDFSNSLYKQVSTTIYEDKPSLYLGSTSFVDNIRPNVKYYYIFRSIDVHDQLSNPTEVYQVEIVNENGTIFPNIQIYEFPKEEQRQKTKSVKRFLMLKPNTLQNYMQINVDGNEQSYTELQSSDKIKIGLKDESVFGKKYKLRIVSKNTNKIYDVNFSCEKQINLLEN